MLPGRHSTIQHGIQSLPSQLKMPWCLEARISFGMTNSSSVWLFFNLFRLLRRDTRNQPFSRRLTILTLFSFRGPKDE